MNQSIYYLTDSELKRRAPEAWQAGYIQGLDTMREIYDCPYRHGTVERVAFSKGCWWGFVESDKD